MHCTKEKSFFLTFAVPCNLAAKYPTGLSDEIQIANLKCLFVMSRIPHPKKKDAASLCSKLCSLLNNFAPWSSINVAVSVVIDNLSIFIGDMFLDPMSLWVGVYTVRCFD